MDLILLKIGDCVDFGLFKTKGAKWLNEMQNESSGTYYSIP